ncbi:MULTISPECIES: Type 1 glutamine amidotransferase-like domain-containing protein [unclassified Neorhizobium]|uniref:Type 1 glutamine amidotransferase-like domain-containing protein n=1 Tax=unclassified Neorhizobium TaxID=2629175 RepID=UPI001FF5A2CE|nr:MULTISPECIES: Type 1 glutamine amidotransferase-like domain-containing protein [unclassified Neorhizobium]MCJ9671398.1 peptidase E [Neorhizobium sp. SHOUNA12B]MCJ9744860.1 peptidase E [Neorhizobium sp. SHOUNA12A]
MRLYLSSYRLGDHVEKLSALMHGGKRIAVISNALDFIPAEARRRYETTVYSPIEEFAGLGFTAEPLDLRDYFGKPETLAQRLRPFDLVWALGGNAFLLRRAMRQSGFDGVICDLLDADAVAYGGFSAGAVVATPTLRGIELMDEPNVIAEGYDADIVWEGLGLVDFSIVPHYHSDHDEAKAADKALAWFGENGLPFRAMRDGEVFVVDGGIAALHALRP